MRNLVSVFTILLIASVKALALPYIINTNGVGTNTTLQGTTTLDKVVATNFIGNAAGLTNIPQSATTSLPTDLSQRLSTNDTRSFSLSAGSATSKMSLTTNGSGEMTLDFVIGHVLNTPGVRLRFSDAAGDGGYGELFINPSHDVGGTDPAHSEWQLTMPHNISISPAFGLGNRGNLQWGIGESIFGEYKRNMTNLNSSAGIGNTGPSVWECKATTTGGAILFDTAPGLIGYANLRGGWDYCLANDIRAMSSLGGYAYWQNNMADVIHGVEIYDTTNRIYHGTHLLGAVINERVTGSANGSVGIDFGNALHRDFTASGNSITLYTTNVYAGTTNYQGVICYVRAGGFSPTIAYPPWCTNTALPTSLSPNQMLRLELEATGTGETNIVVANWSVLLDQTFGYDQVVNEFMFRSGLSTLTISNALNTMVKTLKADNTWNQLDALYPFAGTTSAQNKWNLVSTNTYAITFSGTLTHSAGITGDGASGFGNTGWFPASQNDASIFAFFKDWSTTGSACAVGAFNGTPNGHILRVDGGGSSLQAAVSTDFGSMNARFYAAPIVPSAACASRSSAATYSVYRNYGLSTIETVTSASGGTTPVYIFADDNNGTADHFWDKKLQVVALGKSLTQSQYQTLYSACTNLNAALSR